MGGVQVSDHEKLRVYREEVSKGEGWGVEVRLVAYHEGKDYASTLKIVEDKYREHRELELYRTVYHIMFKRDDDGDWVVLRSSFYAERGFETVHEKLMELKVKVDLKDFHDIESIKDLDRMVKDNGVVNTANMILRRILASAEEYVRVG
jgi:hypothetical protein